MKNNKQYTIGIDIGGTNMKSVLYDGTSVVTDYILATPKDTVDHFMIMLYALIEPLLKKSEKDKVKIKGIGIGAPGIPDFEKRTIFKNTAPNIALIEGFNFLDILEQKIGLPCFLDNDAKCFVRGEALRGAGMKYKNIYGIIIGTGIGGGWWYDSKVYMGAHGGAGEPGEMLINFEHKILLEDAYHKLTQNNPAGVAEEAYRGDLLAEKVYQEVGEYLGMAFANIVNIIDPEIFVIGGSVIESSSLFIKYTKKALREHVVSINSKNIPILKSRLGKDAGAIGAALLVA